MIDPREPGFFQCLLGAIKGTAIDGQNRLGRCGGFENAGNASSNPGETKHLARAIAIQLSCGLIRQFTDIGTARTRKNQFGSLITLAGTATTARQNAHDLSPSLVVGFLIEPFISMNHRTFKVI
jgi:hypothetical protein